MASVAVFRSSGKSGDAETVDRKVGCGHPAHRTKLLAVACLAGPSSPEQGSLVRREPKFSGDSAPSAWPGRGLGLRAVSGALSISAPANIAGARPNMGPRVAVKLAGV